MDAVSPHPEPLSLQTHLSQVAVQGLQPAGLHSHQVAAAAATCRGCRCGGGPCRLAAAARNAGGSGSSGGAGGSTAVGGHAEGSWGEEGGAALLLMLRLGGQGGRLWCRCPLLFWRFEQGGHTRGAANAWGAQERGLAHLADAPARHTAGCWRLGGVGGGKGAAGLPCTAAVHQRAWPHAAEPAAWAQGRSLHVVGRRHLLVPGQQCGGQQAQRVGGSTHLQQ